jgi:ankyrin repeat protein
MVNAERAWQAGTEPNPRPALLHAIWRGERALVLDALRDNPDLLRARLSGNRTPLLAAADGRQIDLANDLIELGAELDYITAIALNRRDVVEAMLDRRPSLIHKQAPYRVGCLHVATHLADGNLIGLLLSRGADPNDSRNPGRITPLFCVGNAPLENAETLILAGADVNARSKDRFTPLHLAGLRGRIEVVKLLLAHGARANAQTRARQTPWALAVRCGHREAAEVLQSA